MKHFLTILLLVLACVVTAQAKGPVSKAYFTLEPQITSQNVENKVKTGMRYETGVQAVEVNRQQQIVSITFDAENSLCITGSGSGMPGFDPIELDLDF